MKNEGLQPIINGCRNNDRRCQKALYDRFYGYALSVALPYCGHESEARTVLNDAFLKVFTGIGRYDEALPFTPWLRAIVIRTAINHYRKHLLDLNFDDLADGMDACVEDDYLLRVEAEEVVALVQKLPPAYRMTLNLYALEGYSHQEIAASLGVSVGASKSNLSKARTKLKQMMTDQLINDLRHRVTALGNGSVLEKTIHRRDTLWRTVYVRVKPVESVSSMQESSPVTNAIVGLHQPSVSIIPQQKVLENADIVSKNVLQSIENQQKTAALHSDALLDSTNCVESLILLPSYEKTLLELPKPNITRIGIQVSELPEVKKTTTPYAEKKTNALCPRFFKIGASTGWLYATSKGLMHEGGYSFGMQGQVGLSRHWAINISYIQGRAHYKTLTNKASLILEGFYQRQWEKNNSLAPDLTDVRAGLNWLF